MAIKAVELMVSGRVQKVGYRDFVAEIGQALNLAGSVENLKNGTVRIRCKGEAAAVEKFKSAINVKNPLDAPLIVVEKIAEKPLEEEEITELEFEEKYSDPNKELVQAIRTGSKYMGHVLVELKQTRSELGGKLDNLSAKTEAGFNKTDVNFQVLSDKYGKISNTMERIDKNIETIAVNKKRIF